MAKSVRASVSKRNRANLRKKVFGPAVDARTERLAAKLQEIASQPRPEGTEQSAMETGSDEAGMFYFLRNLLEFGRSNCLLFTADRNENASKPTAADEGTFTTQQ